MTIQPWFKHVWEDASNRINTFRESAVLLCVQHSEDLEKSTACADMEVSIELILQDFERCCGDMYNATYLPDLLVNPEDTSICLNDSASGVQSRSRHRRRKSSRRSCFSGKRSSSFY